MALSGAPGSASKSPLRFDPTPRERQESNRARHYRILRRLKLRAPGHQSGGRAQTRIPGHRRKTDPVVRGTLRGDGRRAPGLLQSDHWPACGSGRSR